MQQHQLARPMQHDEPHLMLLHLRLWGLGFQELSKGRQTAHAPAKPDPVSMTRGVHLSRHILLNNSISRASGLDVRFP